MKKIECLLLILDTFETERIRQELQINDLKKSLILQAGNEAKNIERQIALLDEEIKEKLDKIRIAKKMIKSQKVKKNEVFKAPSLIERLYIILNKEKQDLDQMTLDITFWEDRIQKGEKELKSELEGFNKSRESCESRIRMLEQMIKDEEKNIGKRELAKVLKKVKFTSKEDNIESTIDWFEMAIIPLEINLSLWEMKLINQYQQEIRERIMTVIMPEIKKSIELNEKGKMNAINYLKNMKGEK